MNLRPINVPTIVKIDFIFWKRIHLNQRYKKKLNDYKLELP